MMTKSKTSGQPIFKLLAVLLAVLLIAVYIPTICVGAATTTVKTLEDLKNMSKDLGGTYKLGATIDCGGATLTPIGNLAKPFTGTFTCPTSSDGKPLYAITNFKIAVKIGVSSTKEQNDKYKSNGDSNWCVGLFGVAQKATFKDIVLLNASVTSDIIGGVKDDGKGTINKGMEEQATGIFCGAAVGTTFKNCGVQGSVSSYANNVGSFVGLATKEIKSSDNKTLVSGSGCTIQNCYAYGEAKGGGAAGSVGKGAYGYNFGGFIGLAKSANITGCFFDGTITGDANWCNAGGFIGSFNNTTKLNACYSAGSGSSIQGPFAGVSHVEADICEISKQCYSSLKIGSTPLNADANPRSGNFVTATTGANQNSHSNYGDRFAVKSAGEINTAFAANANWQTYTDGATLPTVKALTGKTIKAVADLPAGVTTPGADSGSNTSGGGNGGDTDTEEIDDSELLSELNACKTAEDVTKLFPSVDKALVDAIVAYKEANGEFASIDDLKKVEGVTDEIIETMRSDFLNSTSGGEDETVGGNGDNGGTFEVVVNDGAGMDLVAWLLVIVLTALNLLLIAGSVVIIILLAKRIKALAPAEAAAEDVVDADTDI